MDQCIKGNQTAYIKGRMINDNIRSVLSSVAVANNEENIDGLVMSLDAKKAFDSVSHKFIETCLVKFGVGQFGPIFRILYQDLRTDILINQKIVPGFVVKRGVKQGDALSCILFIMCMEPLLRNLERNQDIIPVSSLNLGNNLPKVYAYADDVNIVTINSDNSVQAIFNEYERLSKASGLELNANKTELIRFKSGGVRRQLAFNVRYLNNTHRIETKNEIKINGILVQQDLDRMRTSNIENVERRIVDHCKQWSRRRLCILGKILIVKTFGISQIVYLMQTIKLEECDFKRLNSVLYKFIWNSHFEAAKAPERLSRDIINTSIKLGGFGMLDIKELDAGIKLRALGRLYSTDHPMLKLVLAKINQDEFFYPKLGTKIDGVATCAIDLLGHDRRKLWWSTNSDLTSHIVSLIRNIKLASAVSSIGKNSLSYFGIRRRGIDTISGLTRDALNSLRRFVDPNLYSISCYAIERNVNLDTSHLEYMSWFNGKLCDLRTKSSKEIRDGRCTKDPICLYRSGLIQTPSETLSWCKKLNSLTSTKHKSILLRAAHKEIYTKEKLFRFHLVDSPECPRCDEIDTFQHKLFDCAYTARIWIETFKITDKLLINPVLLDLPTKALGMAPYIDSMALAIHAEILSRILSLRDNSTYLIRPKIFVAGAINHLICKENKESKKLKLRELLFG